MKERRSLARQASPLRALVEGWLVCAVLLIPILPVVLESTPLARSLYLILLPLVCAAAAGLRLRFFSATGSLAVLKECGVGLVLGLGILNMVMGVFAGLGRMDSITYSSAGTQGTVFFLIMAAPEYLGVRLLTWAWLRWDRLRRRRYVWALTHASLVVVGGMGLLVLTGVLIFLAIRLGTDIWDIPPGSPFALSVFWLSVMLILSSLLMVVGVILFIPPTTLFSFIVARKLTARLENLAATTQALRKGDLAARSPVQGEDEIAQLQSDFNGMAADLEQSVLALQGEKDKVWTLMEARRELVAGVSHELRNPVAIILGYSDSLRRGWQDRPPEEVNRDLEAIHYEASRLQTILNDLLTASQAEVGHLQIAPVAVDVIALAQRLVETFSGLAWGSKRVHVSLSAPPQAVFALADPLRLEQVLVNLVQNAVRHTSPGGLVAVEIHPDTGRIRIEVEDTGEGIPAEELPHIWEKYYQGGSPQRRAAYGMGLGLALVKELTEAMGGTVSVESCPGQGSVFKVHLPVCGSSTFGLQ